MKSIFIKTKDGMTPFKVKEVEYIQALGDYCNIYTTGKRHTVHSGIGEIEKHLPSCFVRIHRSYMVNIDKVTKIAQGVVYVGEFPLPIGEHFHKSFLDKITIL